MYYEEKLIEGRWYFRDSPHGQWTLIGIDRLHSKIDSAISKARTARAALTLWRDYDALDPDAPDDVARYQEAIDATHAALNGIE